MIAIGDLEEIREKAECMARTPMMHPAWKRGYQRLADAADYLSLLNLRSCISDHNKESKE